MKRGGTIASIVRSSTGLGSAVDLATPMLEGKDFSQPSTIETIAEVSEPQLEVGRRYFAPVVKDHHGEASVERVAGGAFHDDNTAAQEGFPGPKAIKAAPVWADHKSVVGVGGGKIRAGHPPSGENNTGIGLQMGADIVPRFAVATIKGRVVMPKIGEG